MLFRKVHDDKVPALGFGTFELTGKTCYQAVRQALDLGYRHIDTARIYGNEKEVGRAIAESGVPRDEIFLTSKLWFEDLSSEALFLKYQYQPRSAWHPLC